jgi:hypothetical protein
MNISDKILISCFCLVFALFFGGLFKICWKERDRHDGWFWAGFGGIGSMGALIYLVFF